MNGNKFTVSPALSGTCGSASGTSVHKIATIAVAKFNVTVKKTDRYKSLFTVASGFEPVGDGTECKLNLRAETTTSGVTFTGKIICRNGKFLFDDESWKTCTGTTMKTFGEDVTISYPIASSATPVMDGKIVTIGTLMEALAR